MPDSSGAADLSRRQQDLALRAVTAAQEQARRTAGMAAPATPGPQGAPSKTTTIRQMPMGAMVEVSASVRPSYLTPDLQRRAAELDEQRTANNDKIAELVRLGGGQGGVMPGSIAGLRAEVLLDYLFPPDTRKGQGQRLDYEKAVQDRIAEMLDGLESQIWQARLAAGAQVPQHMLEKMAAQQGLAIPAAERGKQG
jgi:hypothetical protein